MTCSNPGLCECLFAAVVVAWPFARPASALDVYHLDSGLTPAQVRNRPYSYYVRQCVDTLMQYGTDHYGAVNTPVLMGVIDVRNRLAPQNPLPLDEAYRTERRGRRSPGGGNLWMDQETLRVMYDLAKKTGQAGYAAFANEYIRYYTTNIVNDKRMINWGLHQYYNAYNDVRTYEDGDQHEIHFQQARWPMLAGVNPTAITNEINGIWKYHVMDERTGRINRHSEGDRDTGCDFAFTGGTLLSAFAFEYQRTGSPLWLDRARLVANYYWNKRNTTTDLFPTTPIKGTTRIDGCHFDTSNSGLYAGCLLDAYQRTNDTLFRDQAVAYLKAYARYGYDSATGKWWGSLRLDGTPEPGPRAAVKDTGENYYENRGYVDIWQPYFAGYEQPLNTAGTYARAAKLTGDPALLQAARRWADFISRSLPAGPCEAVSWYGEYAADWAPYGTYAENYGKTIEFFLDMADLTKDAKYVALARSVADDAVSKLYYNGLFRGHPCKPYYEALDGVGDLLGALLRLDGVQ